MESFNHLKFAELERRIIEYNNSYSGLKHDFSDSGKLSGEISSYSWHVLKISDYQELYNIDFKDKDVFFGLFVGSDYKIDNLFFKSLNSVLLESRGRLIKADTTKSPFNFSFIVICVCKCAGNENISYFGSLDSYVEGIHFSKNNTAYKITELSSASDILTKNIELKDIYSFNFNSNENESFFSNSYLENVNLFNKEIYVHLVIGAGKDSNYRISSGDNIYLLGYAGLSKLHNYKLDFNYIYKNVIDIRERVFKKLGNEFISSDLSDGFESSFRNMTYNLKNLSLIMDYQSLLEHCKKIDFNISLEQIMNGGDDYSLLLFSKSIIYDEDLVKIGTVK